MKKAAGKHKTDSFLHVLLHQRPHPVQKTQRPARKDPVQDDWPGDGKNLAADSEDLPFLLVFNGRSSHGVGKTGDRDKGAGSSPFCQPRIDAGAGEQYAEQNEHKRGPAAAFVGAQIPEFTVVINDLAERADGAAKEKRLEHVEPDIMPGSLLVDIFFVFFFMF